MATENESVLRIRPAVGKKLEREAARRHISVGDLLGEIADHRHSASNPGNPDPHFDEETEQKVGAMEEAVYRALKRVEAEKEDAEAEAQEAKAEEAKAREEERKKNAWPW